MECFQNDNCSGAVEAYERMCVTVVAAEAADELSRRMLNSITPSATPKAASDGQVHPLYHEVRQEAHNCARVLTQVRQNKITFEQELTTKLPAPEQAVCPLSLCPLTALRNALIERDRQ